MNTKKVKNKTESRTKNTLRNIASGLGNKVINLLLPFAIRTIMIYKLGADYVGVSSLFTAILQILNVSELGFASAIVFAMYEPVAKNDTEGIISKIGLCKTVYKLVGCFIVTAGLIVLPLLPKLIKGPPPSSLNIYFVYLVFLANTAISYFAYGFKNSVLIVYQRRRIIDNINSVINILRSAFQILTLLLFRNYYIYILAIPISTLASNLAVNHFANKYYPELNVQLPFSLSEIKSISKQVGGIAIGRISLVCRNSLDSIILSSTLGLTITAIYSNYYYVFSALSAFLVILLTSMAASVGNSLVTDSKEKNERDHRRFDCYFEIAVCFCVICLYCMYQPFMKIWVGSDLMLSQSSVILFCIYFFVNHLSQIRSVYSEAAGLWWNFKHLAIGELVANLILNIVLGKLFGVNGIIFATIITAFGCSFIGCTLITYKKLFQTSAKQYFLNNLYYFFVTIVGCAVIGFVSDYIAATTWLMLVIKGFACATMAVVYLALSVRINSTIWNYFSVLLQSIIQKTRK